MRFLHMADLHLGYQQYGLKDRFNDFGRVFIHIAGQAVERDVDFVILAGDLFEKRSVEPLAMRQAIAGLSALRDAGIPVLAIEGNHERAYYRDSSSWLEFLDALDYLKLLHPEFTDGRAILTAHTDAARGAYVDLPGGIRVYGLKYLGASTGSAVRMLGEALTSADRSGVQYTILMMHAGLEGQLDRYSGTLTHNDLGPLHDTVDYLALGHIHKPYIVDDWIFNPGSPETCGMDEAAWEDRGYFVVDVDPARRSKHLVEHIAPPRRPFHRMTLKVDGLASPNAVADAVRRLIARERPRVPLDKRPVVELTLSGILPFNRIDLDLDYVQGLIDDAWAPLCTRVRNQTAPADFEISVDSGASRPELEQAVLKDLLGRDLRFRPAAADWTRVALDIKRLALDKAPASAIIAALRAARTELTEFAELDALAEGKA